MQNIFKWPEEYKIRVDRAKNINQIRQKRIDSVAQVILDKWSVHFDWTLLEKTKYGYSYNNIIFVNQKVYPSIDGDEIDYYLHVGQDRLMVSDEIIKEIYRYCRSKYQEYDKQRIMVNIEKM